MINAIQNNPVSLEQLQGTWTQNLQLQRIEPQMPRQDDVVNIHRPELMSDEEAAEAMSMVQASVQQNSAEALSVHGGLDYSRVMALLADI